MKVFMIGTELHNGSKKVGNITPTNFRFKSEAWLNGNGVTVHTITGKIEHYDVVDGEPVLAEVGIESQLNGAKLESKNYILDFADNLRKSLAKSPSYMEVAGWASKLALAEKYQGGVTLTDAELLRINTEILLRDRGESIDTLTGKVIKQSTDLALAVSFIDGMQSSALRACDMCQTAEELHTMCEALKTKATIEIEKLKGI
tara:strand:+ start:4946 stop:5551 length:606 start_codon:yes stop_codon:yes gene_type:complete